MGLFNKIEKIIRLIESVWKTVYNMLPHTKEVEETGL